MDVLWIIIWVDLSALRKLFMEFRIRYTLSANTYTL